MTTSPGSPIPAAVCDFAIVIAGAGASVTVAPSMSVTAGPVGGVPLAVAVLTTLPLSTSACVRT